MITLIASDLDGTLLKSREEIIPEKTRHAIMSAIASGISFAVISGRDVPSLKKILSFAGDKPYYIGCNGSVCVKDGKVLYSRPISDTVILKALTYAKSSGRNVVFCGADTVYVSGMDCFKKHVTSLYGDGSVIPVNITPDIKAPIYKISFFTPKGSDKPDFSDFGVRCSYDKNGWTEYVNRFANKGGALALLESRAGALKQNTASLGDSKEDSEMFNYSALAFAFGDEAENAFLGALRVDSFSEAYEIIRQH